VQTACFREPDNRIHFAATISAAAELQYHVKKASAVELQIRG